jgi:hypothetical protein
MKENMEAIKEISSLIREEILGGIQINLPAMNDQEIVA